MSKKQKTAADVRQPLTSDFYSTSENLVEDVPLTPAIAEELAKLVQCWKKKKPENRVKHWKEYQQSQVVERSSSPSEEEKVESRAQEVEELGPLARIIHYPLTPVHEEPVANVDQEFALWLRELPYPGLENSDSFKFLPGYAQLSFESTRLILEPRLETRMTKVQTEQLMKSRTFFPFSTQIEHPTCTLRSFASPRFYVFLVFNAKERLLNYFVHES